MTNQLAPDHIKTIAEQLTRIANALEAHVKTDLQAPNYVKPISEFSTFDWSTIGASVVNHDSDGPTHVEWNGAIWTRRSPTNKFEPAIWFSRGSGKSEDGDVIYLRLITFREIKNADPIPSKLASKIEPRNGVQPSTKPQPPIHDAPPPASTPSVSSTKYYIDAQGLGLSALEAADIAKFAKIDTHLKGVNFASAYKLLEYFSIAKLRGRTIPAAVQLLEAHHMDPQSAIKILSDDDP